MLGYIYLILEKVRTISFCIILLIRYFKIMYGFIALAVGSVNASCWI